MKFHVIRLLVKYWLISFDVEILVSSLAEERNVFALSDIKVAGRPHRLANLLIANKNEFTPMSGVSSRWIALVEAQVNRHM